MKVRAHAELTIDIETSIDLNSDMPVKDQVAEYISSCISRGQVGGLNVLEVKEVKQTA